MVNGVDSVAPWSPVLVTGRGRPRVWGAMTPGRFAEVAAAARLLSAGAEQALAGREP
jgi:hypothetical protein